MINSRLLWHSVEMWYKRKVAGSKVLPYGFPRKSRGRPSVILKIRRKTGLLVTCWKTGLLVTCWNNITGSLVTYWNNITGSLVTCWNITGSLVTWSKPKKVQTKASLFLTQTRSSKHQTSCKNSTKTRQVYFFHRFWPFICCLSVILGPDKGDFPENVHTVCPC